MMQATDFWDSDDSSDAAMLNGAGVGAIFVERKMRAGALVIVDIRGQDAAQMALVEDHEVIRTLAPDRTDHVLDASVCQGERGAVTTRGYAPSLRPGYRNTSHTTRRDRAADTGMQCSTGTLRLLDAIASSVRVVRPT